MRHGGSSFGTTGRCPAWGTSTEGIDLSAMAGVVVPSPGVSSSCAWKADGVCAHHWDGCYFRNVRGSDPTAVDESLRGISAGATRNAVAMQ